MLTASAGIGTRRMSLSLGVHASVVSDAGRRATRTSWLSKSTSFHVRWRISPRRRPQQYNPDSDCAAGRFDRESGVGQSRCEDRSFRTVPAPVSRDARCCMLYVLAALEWVRRPTWRSLSVRCLFYIRQPPGQSVLADFATFDLPGWTSWASWVSMAAKKPKFGVC